MKRALLVLTLLLATSPASWAADESHGSEIATASEKDHGATPAEGEHAGAEEPQSYFGIPGSVLKFINLVVFLGLLAVLLRKPITGALESRRGGIRAQLAEAEERRKKADSLAEDIKARLSQIEGEVDAILARAREEGERQKTEIIAAAEVESKKILSSAKSQIDQKISQARRELTDYAGQLAAAKARTMIESTLTDQDREVFFEESVGKIKEMKS